MLSKIKSRAKTAVGTHHGDEPASEVPMLIGGPTDFKHESSFAFDEKKGAFEMKNLPTQIQNVFSGVNELLLSMGYKGITRKEAQLILKMVAESQPGDVGPISPSPKKIFDITSPTLVSASSDLATTSTPISPRAGAKLGGRSSKKKLPPLPPPGFDESLPVDGRDRPRCPLGAKCTSVDMDHFMRFMHSDVSVHTSSGQSRGDAAIPSNVGGGGGIASPMRPAKSSKPIAPATPRRSDLQPIKELQHVNKTLNDENVELTQQVRDLSSQVYSLRQTKAELEHQLSSSTCHSNELSQVKCKLDAMSARVSSLEKEREGLQSENSSLREEVSRMKAQLDAAGSTSHEDAKAHFDAELERIKRTTEADLKSTHSALKRQKALRRAEQEKMRSITEELATLRREASDGKSAANALARVKEAASADRKNYQAMLEEAAIRENELRSKLASVNRDLNAMAQAMNEQNAPTPSPRASTPKRKPVPAPPTSGGAMPKAPEAPPALSREERAGRDALLDAIRNPKVLNTLRHVDSSSQAKALSPEADEGVLGAIARALIERREKMNEDAVDDDDDDQWL